jgi:PST family polysaccharide transporter
VIARELGDAATGYYSLAFRIVYMPYIIVAVALGGVAFPIYSKMMRDRPEADISAAFGQFLHANFVVVGGLYLLLALNADRVVLISSRWSQSGPVLSILCIYGFLLSLLQTCYVALRASGRLRTYVAAETLHALVLGLALVVFTPLWGIQGAAFAQVLAISAILAGVLIPLIRLGTVVSAHITQAIFRPMLCLLVTGAIGLALNSSALIKDPYSMTAAVMAGAALTAVYMLTLMVLNMAGIRAAMLSIEPRAARDTGRD